MASLLPPFVEGLPDGVSRASLPILFRVGRVNCYLLADPPVTVIDPGTMQAGSLDELAALLNSRGLGFGDIEQIVVTHAHPDHFGAAAAVSARSDGRIVSGLPEVASLVGPRDSDGRHDLLVRLGVPDATARSLIGAEDSMLERLVRWARPSLIKGVGDGDPLVAGGRQLVCVVTSGHTAGHISLWDPAARVLFSGDHLLGRLIPVPSLEDGRGAGRRHSLVEYLAGLQRFVALDPTIVLPGHGRPFTEVGALAARLRSHSLQRAEDIAAILLGGPSTPYEVARQLQWQPEGARLVMGIAHVQGHLDLLEEAGRVTSDLTGRVSWRVTSYACDHACGRHGDFVGLAPGRIPELDAFRRDRAPAFRAARLRMDLLPSHRKFELTPTGGMTTLPMHSLDSACGPTGPGYLCPPGLSRPVDCCQWESLR